MAEFRRTMIRVDSFNQKTTKIILVIPGWDPSSQINLFLDDLPLPVQEAIMAGKRRFWAMANLGAENTSQMFIKNWEP